MAPARGDALYIEGKTESLIATGLLLRSRPDYLGVSEQLKRKEDPMTETARLVDYYYTEAPDKPGEAQRILDQLRHAGVFLLAFSGFPKGRRAQLDFIPANAPAFKAAARKAHWKVVGPRKAFLIYGEDRIGIVADLLASLAEAKINVTATQAIIAGADRFGMILWVKPRDVKRAAKVLGAG
jgi:hypothetical protein